MHLTHRSISQPRGRDEYLQLAIHSTALEVEQIEGRSIVDTSETTPQLSKRTIRTDEDHPTAIEDEQMDLKGSRLAIVVFVLMVGNFLTGLDASILANAVPKITADFHSLNEIGWYLSSYLVASMAFQPIFGKVYSYFRVKSVFIAAVLVFQTGSIICATAHDSPSFIAGRAVAGIGQAALLSGGLAIVSSCVPLVKRAMVFALLASANELASASGPLIGGIFTDSPRLTWRFCFWINLPLGAVVILVGVFVFESPPQLQSGLTLKDKLVQMDFAGAGLFASGMVCLFVALQRGGNEYPWSDSQVWGWILGFGLAITLFITLEIHLGDKAMIPPRVLSQRPILACCSYMFLLSLGNTTLTNYLPFYFQSARGLSARDSGIQMLPYLASLMSMSLVIGGLLGRISNGIPFMQFGSAVFAVATGLLGTLRIHSSTSLWVGYEMIAGIGYGSTIIVAMITLQANLPAKDLPVGNALVLISIFAGGAVAASIAQTTFYNVLTTQLKSVVSPAEAATILSAGATGILSAVSPALVEKVQEVYCYSITKTFLISTGAAVIGFFCTFCIHLGWRKKQISDLGGLDLLLI